jgi:leader peptidase (prepilin peptidase)/N-methyltransferase
MLGVLIGYCALLGLAVGSFLNVIIYRVPRHESILSPPSACPSCGAPIGHRDNVPVFSWIVLRGRCRACSSPISVQYPLVELTTAALFAGTAARFGFNWDLPAFLAFLAGLLALAIIDFERMLLPKAIVYPHLAIVGALLVLAAAASGQWHSLVVGVFCALGWFVTFFALNAISPRLLGFGDVRLALVLGLALGWLGVRYVLLGFFAANLIGAIIGIALIATKRISRKQQIPYGVFLAMGTALAIFAGPELLRPFAQYG